MGRNVTVTFDDGSTHVYQGVPDDATPDQVEARASKDFAGKKVKSLDGGKAAPPVTQEPLGDVNDRTSRARREYNQRLLNPNSQEFKDYLTAAKQSGFQGSAAELFQQVQDDVAKETRDTQTGNYGVKKLAKDVAMTPVGLGEEALSLGTGLVSTPLAGLAGLVTSPLGFIPGWEGVGARNVERVANALTYQPRSDAGQTLQQVVNYPFEKLAEGGDYVATNTPLVNKSPLAQTAVNTTIQSLPALLFRKGGPLRRGAPAAAEVAESGAAKAAQSSPGTGTAAQPGTTATSAAAAAAETPNVGRAKAYVNDTLKLDWDSLSKPMQDKLSTIAQDAKALDNLDPASVARQLKFESLDVPVPATRGTLARDPVAMRNEANASATAAGQPIRDIDLAANKALIDNLDVLQEKVSGTGKTAATATTAEQTGASVQGAARGKLELQKAKVKELYKKADEAGETLQTVDTKGILETVADSVDQPHYSYAKSWLKANEQKVQAGEVTIRDLEKLRQQAVAKALNGGEDAHYAGQLIKAIDQATEGTGGKLYQEARAARKAQALEFEEQGAVFDLVSNASRTDRVTALENTTKTILSGSLEDVRKIKKTLLTGGGDETTRTTGRKAWRDVRRQVIEDIKAQATKGVALNPDGTPNLSPSALKSVIDKYGPEKLDEIFGPGTTKQLNKILDVARDAKTLPPTAAGRAGSSTMANLLAFLEKGLTKVPVVGGPTVEIARGVAQVKNIGAAAREANKATTTPLNEALKQAKGKQRRQEVVGTADQLDPALVPLSQVGAQQPRR